MIVVDASAILHLLLSPGSDAVFEQVIAGRAAAPDLIDIEVLHVLRRMQLVGKLPEQRAREALADYATLPIVRYSHAPLLARIWALHASITAYDGAYVALAESLSLPLITRDARLARSSGHTARIEYIA